jgi:hypothetical protein
MRTLSDEHERRVDSTVRSLEEWCMLSEIPHVQLETMAVEIENLRCFEGVDALDVIDGYILNAPTEERVPTTSRFLVCKVSTVEVSDGPSHTTTRTRRIEPYGVVSVQLGVDMGRVFMRPERLGDKFAEWFKKREVDFDEHALFSSKYYVLATDEAKLRREATRCFLDAIARYNDMVIEIVNGTFYAMLPRVVNETDARRLAQLSFDVYGSILEGESKWAK